MPCYQASNYPGGVPAGAVSHATLEDCTEYCKEGACCEGATCSIKPQCQCQGANQVFEGVGTTCTPNPCNPSSGACCCCVEIEAFMPFPATSEALALFFCQIQYDTLIAQGVTPCKECRAHAVDNEISPFSASLGAPFCVPSSGGAEDCDCVSQLPAGRSHELLSFAANEPCGVPTAAGYSLCNSQNPLP